MLCQLKENFRVLQFVFQNAAFFVDNGLTNAPCSFIMDMLKGEYAPNYHDQ